MTNLKTFIKKNSEQILEFGNVMHDLEVTADTEDNAIAILNGLDGGKAYNILRDAALAEGFDVIRDATQEEIANY